MKNGKFLKTVLRMAACVAILALGAAPARSASIIFVSNAAEIRAAMGSAQAGDTLVMRNGVWMSQDIIFEGHGAPDAPITLRAETPGQVLLTGASRLRIGGSHLVVDGLYFKDGSLNQFGTNIAVVEFRAAFAREAYFCRLTNSVIENYNPPPPIDMSNQYKWVSLYGAWNRVDHCTFKGKTNIGSLLTVVRATSEPQYHLIEHNHFADREPLGRDPATGNLFNGGEIIRIGDSAQSLSDSFTRVESNLFERCNGEIEIVSSKSGGNAFRYNTFRKSQGTLTLRHGNGALVEGNFFLGENEPDTGGIRVIGEDHVLINNYFSGIAGARDNWRAAVTLANGRVDSPLSGYFQVKRALIAHNTFVGNERNIIVGGGRSELLSLAPEGCSLVNNVVVKVELPRDHCLIQVVDEGSDIVYRGNIMYGGSPPDGICLGLSPAPDGIMVVDPGLAPSEDGLHRPVPGSPLIDGAGDEYPEISTDMDGQPRQDGRKDVGADEVSPAPSTRRPLTAQDVGAEWARQP